MNITLPQARASRELVTISDSQMLRFIDEINGIANSEQRAKEIHSEITQLKKQPVSRANKAAIRGLYDQLDDIQYKKDYVCIIADSVSDFRRACRGFKINGIEYTRLLGTSGGIKNSTVVFVNKALYPTLISRIDNGRDQSKAMIPAKFEAYRSLVCSGSTPVSDPKGILVVPDCVTHFRDTIIELSDAEAGDPTMQLIPGAEVELIDSDGYGLMLPDRSLKWAHDLGEDYILSGCCIRNSFCKGMLFTFDFIEFAEKVAHTYEVIDAWGQKRDIRDADVILTTSMLKLWDSYDSCEDYLRCCEENHYTFAVSKTCPEKLENERNLNYQFIQSYNLTDQQIDELISPTVQEFKDVLGWDYRRSLLFLRGVHLTPNSAASLPDDYIKGIMIEPSLIYDSYVREKIHQMIKTRIDNAKVGVIKVHGNFSIVGGDSYALCQSIFQMPITGLLKAGEIYSRYWSVDDTDRVVVYRAPMTCHNNIRVMSISKSPEAAYWYRYITTATLFNAWDTAAHALNGMDKDGDQVLTTNNPVLLNSTRRLPALMCIQRKAEKKIVTEKDLINANIKGFGDEIGATTNHVTSMYDVQAQYLEGSDEYKELEYRIMCGQLFQQNAIDKLKGIIAKDMPREWYDKFYIYKQSETKGEAWTQWNHSIAACKKPYFMKYIYPNLNKEYRKVVSGYNELSLTYTGLPLEDLLRKTPESEKEKELIQGYWHYLPVSTGNSLMNRICRKIEDSFSSYRHEYRDQPYFDLRSLIERNHPAGLTRSVKAVYKEYVEAVKAFHKMAASARLDSYETVMERQNLLTKVRAECYFICSSEDALCDIILALCYNTPSGKQFTWDMCAPTLIKRLLRRSGNTLSYPIPDPDGDIKYAGERFNMIKVTYKEA